MTKRGSTTIWPALLLVALVAAAHGRILTNEFTFDDHQVLVDNPAVQKVRPPLEYLLDARTHGTGDRIRAYRPLRTLGLSLEHAAFGLNPRPYHAVNLLLHALVTLLAWRLARRYLNRAPALAVGILIACHPLLTETIASVKSQDDLLAALLILIAALVFTGRAPDRRSGAMPWLLIPLFLVGVLAKESVLILPALLLALWLVTPSPAGFRARLRGAPWPLLLALVGMGIGFLLFRRWALEGAATERAVTPALGWLFPSSLAQVPLVLKLFLFPVGLSVDYSHLGRLGLGSGLLWMSVAGQAVAAFLLWRTGLVGVRLGLVWFYLTLLPSLNLLGAYFIFAERFAYLPAVGLALLVVTGLGALLSRARAPRPDTLVLGITAALVPLLIIASISRAGDWRDSETLFRAALRVRPETPVMRGFLADELLRQGRLDEARSLTADRAALVRGVPRSFAERALLEKPAVAALLAGDDRAAADLYRRITAGPYHKPHDWLNYGTALTNLGDYDEARRVLEEARRLLPEDAGPLRMLGRVALETGDFRDAAARFTRACRLDPGHAGAWYFSVFATWKAEGDTAALARLVEASRAGQGLGTLFGDDQTRWEGAGEELDREIRARITAASAGLGH